MTVIQLSSINGTNGFVIPGVQSNAAGTIRLSELGDVNGDGITDIIVGFSTYDAPEGGGFFAGNAGVSYVVFGTNSGFPAEFDLDLLDGTNGFQINGVDANDFSGVSVASAGDFNNDGIDDIIVGARRAGEILNPSPGVFINDFSGSAFIVYGSNTGFSAMVELGNLNGTDGIELKGIDDGDNAGFTVGSLGDVNGDGIDDVIVGAPNANVGGLPTVGESYVIFGSGTPFSATFDLSTLNGSNGFKIEGVDAVDRFGWTSRDPGDINGDGINDIVVGAWSSTGGAAVSGQVFVFYGTSAGYAASMDVDDINGTNGFIINGISALDWVGDDVSFAGDINGDGIDDLVISGIGVGADVGDNEGAAYVVFGSTTSFPTTFSLASLNGTNGFVINGETAGDSLGTSVANAGDVNADGFDDLIVGAIYRDTPAGDEAGSAYVIYGSASGFPASINVGSLSNASGFTIEGISAFDRAGGSVSAAGDLNGDGIDDLMVGADEVDAGGLSSAGSVYVIYGALPDMAVTRTGSAIDQTIQGGAFDDILSGLGGDDTLRGNGGNDILIGGDDGDVLDGGANTTIGASAADGIGDTASYAGSDSAILINLGTNFAKGGHALGDSFIGIENLSGSAFDDNLMGDPNANVLSGVDGDDELYGDDGNDLLIGGAGADELDGGAGADTASYDGSISGVRVFLAAGATASTAMNGDADGDTLVNIESLTGSEHNDVLIGNGGINILTGGNGNDEMGSGSGDDTLIGGAGTDVLVGGAGADDLQGGSGFDIAFYLGSSAGVNIDLVNGTGTGGEAEGDTFTSVETIIGSEFADIIIGSVQANTFVGRNGGDTFVGSTAGDIIIGGISAFSDGTGDDTIDYSGEMSAITVNLATFSAQGATIGTDQLFGIERVLGTTIGDNLRGDELDNVLEGRGGADLLNGAGGNDLIIGGSDGDVMIGGLGDDTFRVFNEAGGDIVQDFDFNGDDMIEFSGFGADFDFADLTLTINGFDVLVTGTGWSGSILLPFSNGLVDSSDFTFT